MAPMRIISQCCWARCSQHPRETPSRDVVATLRQWLDERPDYRQAMDLLVAQTDWAIELINKALGVGPEPEIVDGRPTGEFYDDGNRVRSLWAGLDIEGRRMMAAAILLMIALDPPDGKLRTRLPAPVAEVYDLLGNILRDHPWSKRSANRCGAAMRNKKKSGDSADAAQFPSPWAVKTDADAEAKVDASTVEVPNLTRVSRLAEKGVDPSKAALPNYLRLHMRRKGFLGGLTPIKPVLKARITEGAGQ